MEIEIVFKISVVAIVAIVVIALFSEINISSTFKKIFSWKTICIVACCYVCWQAYKMRVSYEEMNKAKITAYEKL